MENNIVPAPMMGKQNRTLYACSSFEKSYCKTITSASEITDFFVSCEPRHVISNNVAL